MCLCAYVLLCQSNKYDMIWYDKDTIGKAICSTVKKNCIEWNQLPCPSLHTRRKRLQWMINNLITTFFIIQKYSNHTSQHEEQSENACLWQWLIEQSIRTSQMLGSRPGLKLSLPWTIYRAKLGGSTSAVSALAYTGAPKPNNFCLGTIWGWSTCKNSS